MFEWDAEWELTQMALYAWFDKFEEAIANGNGDGDREDYDVVQRKSSVFFQFGKAMPLKNHLKVI